MTNTPSCMYVEIALRYFYDPRPRLTSPGEYVAAGEMCEDGLLKRVADSSGKMYEKTHLLDVYATAVLSIRPRALVTPDRAPDTPIPMRLVCPRCGELHIDEGEFATKPHHTHACQGCGEVWRPAVVHTVGVRFLPGFKNDEVET